MSQLLKRLALASCRPFNQQRNGLPRNLLFHHAPPFVILHTEILWNTCYTSQSAFYIICFLASMSQSFVPNLRLLFICFPLQGYGVPCIWNRGSICIIVSTFCECVLWSSLFEMAFNLRWQVSLQVNWAPDIGCQYVVVMDWIFYGVFT